LELVKISSSSAAAGTHTHALVKIYKPRKPRH